MPNTISFAIIGTSKITHRHLRTIRSLPGAKLLGIHGTHAEALADLARTYSLEPTVSIDKLLDRQPNVAVITTSTERHAEVLLQAQERVRTCIVEKPLTTSLQEAQAVAERATRYGNRVFLVSQLRFDPGFVALAQTVRGASAPVAISIMVRKHRGSNYYRGDTSLSKAVFFSQLPHYVDLAGELLGTPLQVRDAHMENRERISRFPDRLDVTLDNSNGQVQLSISTASDKNLPLEIVVKTGDAEFRYRDFSMYRDSHLSWWRNRVLAHRNPVVPDHDRAFLAMYRDMIRRMDPGSADDDMQRALAGMACIDQVIRRCGFRLDGD